MSTPLSVLHLASFSGNIGDNANHMGFRPWFESQVGTTVRWTNLEIREFYWRERDWDEALVAFINDHDMLVVGGGNYFELWVENSPTGTSIAMDQDLFDKIDVPVFFNALGVDPGQGVPEVCRERFIAFLDKLFGSDQYLVSVRNDGARENIRKHVGAAYADRVHELPDHGFFVPTPERASCELWRSGCEGLRVAINLACDMSEQRFSGFATQENFAKEMANTVMSIADRNPDAQFCFVPHIFRDLEIVSQVISFLGDRLRRTRVVVAPYGTGDGAAKIALSLYQTADVVMGMRFHANVCPMALGRSVIALNCYPQIENLYRGLGLTDRLVDVSQPGFGPDTVRRVRAFTSNAGEVSKTTSHVVSDVREKRSNFESTLQGWLR